VDGRHELFADGLISASDAAWRRGDDCRKRHQYREVRVAEDYRIYKPVNESQLVELVERKFKQSPVRLQNNNSFLGAVNKDHRAKWLFREHALRDVPQ
jgi:hypothetical protein